VLHPEACPVCRVLLRRRETVAVRDREERQRTEPNRLDAGLGVEGHVEREVSRLVRGQAERRAGKELHSPRRPVVIACLRWNVRVIPGWRLRAEHAGRHDHKDNAENESRRQTLPCARRGTPVAERPWQPARVCRIPETAGRVGGPHG